MKNVSLTMCSFVLVQIKRFVLLHELLQLQPHEPYCLTLVEYALCAVRLSTSPCVDVNSCCHTVFNVRKHDSVRVHMNSCWNSVYRRIFNVRKHECVCVHMNSCWNSVYRRIFNVRKHESVRVHMNCWNSVYRRIFNVRKHDSVRVLLWLC